MEPPLQKVVDGGVEFHVEVPGVEVVYAIGRPGEPTKVTVREARP